MVRAEQPDGKRTPTGRVLAGHVDEWEDLALDYVDGVLDAETKALIDAHLDVCSSCAGRLEVQRSVATTLKRLPLEEAPAHLEDRVLGEIMFPSRPAPTVRAAAAERSRWSDLWRSRVRPWIPATVAVVALFAALISFGVFRGGIADEAEITTTAAGAVVMSDDGRGANEAGSDAPPTTAAPAATMPGPGLASSGGEQSADATTVGTESTYAAAETPTTTTMATFGTEPPPPERTPTTIQDKKQMVAEIKAADAPLYFVFESRDSKAGPDTTRDHAGAELANQITMLTGLQPVDAGLALGSSTFVAYVPKEDAAAVVELLQSIGASLQLSVGLAWEPIATRVATGETDYPSSLRDRETEFPELDAQRKPPSVSAWSFTTSTLVDQSAERTVSSGWVAPDEAGTHVLIVIYLGE